MIEPFLQAQLEPLAQRQRKWRLQWQLALCWGIAAVTGFIFAALQRWSGFSWPWLMPLLGLATAVASLFIAQRAQKWQPDFRQIARQIEEQHPDLHALLLTAIEQQPHEATGQVNYLQQRVIQQAVEQNQQHQCRG